MALEDILEVSKVSRDGHDYVVRCPHCASILAVEGEDLTEIQGEHFFHRTCGGWLQVSYDAHYVRQLPPTQ